MENKNNEEENCPLADIAFTMGMMSKPFGMLWPETKMIDFLTNRGYLVVSRFNKDTLCDYKVAVQPGDAKIPDTGSSNIKDVFESEVQDIILDILKKNGSKNTGEMEESN